MLEIPPQILTFYLSNLFFALPKFPVKRVSNTVNITIDFRIDHLDSNFESIRRFKMLHLSILKGPDDEAAIGLSLYKTSAGQLQIFLLYYLSKKTILRLGYGHEVRTCTKGSKK